MPRIHITPVVLNLIIINALVFVAFNIYPEQLAAWLQLWKSGLIIPRDYDGLGLFKPLQLVSAFFTHKEIWHIALNMLALFNFGPPLETVMGARRFLISYLVIGVVSTAIVAFLDPSPYPVLGASGALFGMMVLFAFYFPHTKLGIMFLPFRFPVRNFMIGAAVISAGLVAIQEFSGNSMGGISHFGHLAGMIAGFAYLQAGRLRRLGKK